MLPIDVREFEEALDRRDLEHAVTLYTGPFLDGFFLSGASEFEHWVDTERARLAARVAGALEALAAAADTAGGNNRAAAAWWRQLTTLEPLNSRFAVGLMEALIAAWDRAGALRHARAHEQFLAEELGASPDAMMTGLAQRLREEAGLERSGERAAARRAGAGSHPFAAALADRYDVERKLGRGGTTPYTSPAIASTTVAWPSRCSTRSCPRPSRLRALPTPDPPRLAVAASAHTAALRFG